MTRMNGFARCFKQNKFMSFYIHDQKPLEKYTIIRIKIEDLKGVKLFTLSVHDDEYIRSKIKADSKKVDTYFHGLGIPEYEAECEGYTITSVNSLLVYENKYCLQVYLDECLCRTVDK